LKSELIPLNRGFGLLEGTLKTHILLYLLLAVWDALVITLGSIHFARGCRTEDLQEARNSGDDGMPLLASNREQKNPEEE